jgi:hypothetical protein
VLQSQHEQVHGGGEKRQKTAERQLPRRLHRRDAGLHRADDPETQRQLGQRATVVNQRHQRAQQRRHVARFCAGCGAHRAANEREHNGDTCRCAEPRCQSIQRECHEAP